MRDILMIYTPETGAIVKQLISQKDLEEHLGTLTAHMSSNAEEVMLTLARIRDGEKVDFELKGETISFKKHHTPIYWDESIQEDLQAANRLIATSPMDVGFNSTIALVATIDHMDPDGGDLTPEAYRRALIARIMKLPDDEIMEACGLEDTQPNQLLTC